MTEEDIAGLIRLYAGAAARAVKAGADSVELHGANGYLIQQFLSPLTNKRTDNYGGTPEKRLRFALELLQAVREAVGAGTPVIFRMALSELVEGGIEVDDAAEMAAAFADNGATALSFSATTAESIEYRVPPARVPLAWLADRCQTVRTALAGKVPVILAGRIVNCRVAEKLLQEGVTDLVAFGRPLLADPAIVRKYAEKRESDTIPCLSCDDGCIHNFRNGRPIRCVVNPRVGQELLYPAGKAVRPKKIFIIGAGPAGMQAAVTAAERGHEVTLCEKNQDVGGLLETVAIPPFKSDYLVLLASYKKRLQDAKVRIQTGHEVSASDIMAAKADAVIVATGGVPIVPGCCQNRRVKLAVDVLRGQPVGERVLVLGGGYVGCELAEFLAEQGKAVTILEMKDNLCPDMEKSHRILLLRRLAELRVTSLLETELTDIADTGSVIVRSRWHKISALNSFDDVVVALGYAPNKQLLAELAASHFPVKAIGDCAGTGKILGAIQQGFSVAYHL